MEKEREMKKFSDARPKSDECGDNLMILPQWQLSRFLYFLNRNPHNIAIFVDGCSLYFLFSSFFIFFIFARSNSRSDFVDQPLVEAFSFPLVLFIEILIKWSYFRNGLLVNNSSLCSFLPVESLIRREYAKTRNYDDRNT